MQQRSLKAACVLQLSFIKVYGLAASGGFIREFLISTSELCLFNSVVRSAWAQVWTALIQVLLHCVRHHSTLPEIMLTTDGGKIFQTTLLRLRRHPSEKKNYGKKIGTSVLTRQNWHFQFFFANVLVARWFAKSPAGRNAYHPTRGFKSCGAHILLMFPSNPTWSCPVQHCTEAHWDHFSYHVYSRNISMFTIYAKYWTGENRAE